MSSSPIVNIQEQRRQKILKVFENNLKGEVIYADSRKTLRQYKGVVDLIVTSPPYADARKSHYDSVHPNDYVDWFLTFHEPFYEALKPTGSLVINIKDKVTNGSRHRYVWRTIEALADRGWKPIDDYIWVKTNPMPGRWPSRLRDGWEYCFHLAKCEKPYMDQAAVRIPIGNWTKSRLKNLGKNDLDRHNSENRSGFGRDISSWVGKDNVLPSNVFTLPLVGKNYNHPAVFPVGLPEFFIKLFTPKNGIVIDPFSGSGTTGVAAMNLGRNFVLIDNNADYIVSSIARLSPLAEKNGYKLSVES